MANISEKTDIPIDLIWGAEAIGEAIGRTSRQAYGMLEAGLLPGKKIGGRWVISRAKLISVFMEDAA